MKKLLLSSVALLGLSIGAGAAELPLPVKAPPAPPVWVNDIVRSNNQVSVDFAATNFDYLETDTTGASLDSEKGWVPGLSVTGSLMRDVGSVHDLYLFGRFTWLNGHTDYWASGGPVTSNVDGATVEDWDFRLGKGFDVSPNAMVTPFIGGGTHSWTRLLTGPSGYNEVYSHDYAGGGLLVQYSPISRLVLSADGLVGETFDSKMSASDTPGGVPIPPWTFTLGDSAILMLEGSADYAFTEHWHANVGVDYADFQYFQSATNPFGYHEPHSATSLVTLRAGIGYGW